MAAAMQPEGSVTSGLLVLGGVALIVAAAFIGLPAAGIGIEDLGPSWFLSLAAVGFLLAAAGAVGDLHPGYAFTVAAAGGSALWLQWRLRPLLVRARWAIGVLAIVVLGTIAHAVLISLPFPAIDVLLAHEAGAAALADGENPYVTAEFLNSSPLAEPGDTFTGYAYPPLALGMYAISDWLLGDPRAINVVAIAVVIIIMLRSWHLARPDAIAVGATIVIGLALLPDLAFFLRFGWTEPIALPFVVAGALFWRRHPFTSAVFLGLAFATKQYFVLLAPLLLLWNDAYRWRRVAIVGGVVLATLGPFIVLEPAAFWNAVIAPSLDAGFRPDSLNIVALGFTPPPWMAGAMALVVAIPLGRRAGDGAEFALAGAAVLSVAFLFGFQAFANYWFLVVVLCLTAIKAAAERLPQRDPDESEGHPGEDSAARVPVHASDVLDSA